MIFQSPITETFLFLNKKKSSYFFFSFLPQQKDTSPLDPPADQIL